MTAAKPDTPQDALAHRAAEVGARLVETEGPDGEIGGGWWSSTGEGFEIPLMFDYEGEGAFKWWFRVLVTEGRPRVIRFEASTLDLLSPITPEVLHRFPLGRFVEEAALMASRPIDQMPRKIEMWKSVDEVRDARAAVARQHRRRPNGRGRRALTDEFLREVADVYRKHVATGRPSKHVAEHFHYTDASARRVVRSATAEAPGRPAGPRWRTTRIGGSTDG